LHVFLGQEDPMSKMKKIIYYLRKGQLQGVLYEKVFLYKIPEIIGLCSLYFYKMIYRDFYFGKNIKCWGSVVRVIIKSCVWQ
jgi:hypothetical protein